MPVTMGDAAGPSAGHLHAVIHSQCVILSCDTIRIVILEKLGQLGSTVLKGNS